MSEIPFQFKNRRSVVSGYVPEASGLKDGQIFIQQADKEILFKDSNGNLVVIDPKSYVTTGQTGNFGGVAIQTGNFVTTGQTGNFVTTSQTGSFGAVVNTGSFITTGQTGNFITTSQTGNFGGNVNTGSFITTGQTGSFAAAAATGNFITTDQTGDFVTTSQTGSFGGGINISEFVTTGQTGQFITTSQTGDFGGGTIETGSFVTTGQTGVFALTANTGSFVTTGQTGVFALTANTGSFVTTGQTGNFALLSTCCSLSIGTGSTITNSYNSLIVGTGNILSNACNSFTLGTGNTVCANNSAAFGSNNCIPSQSCNSFIFGCKNCFISQGCNSYIMGTGITASNPNALYVNNLVVTSSICGLVCGTGNFVTTSQTGQFVFTGNTGSHITTGQTGAFAPAAGTGVFALAAGTGSFVTTSQTGAFAPAAGTGNFVTISQTGGFASLNGGTYLCSTQIPNITGDICINAGSNISTVYKIQGYPVANTLPQTGATLTFDGSQWVPGSPAAGGNGGGGLVYYFNDTVAADLPTGSLPTSLSGAFELGRSGMLTQKSITSPSLSQASYDPLVGFVSDVLDPDVSAIPAGLFDFNIWASSNSSTQTVLQLKVYKYDGATTTATLLATSDDVYTYDGVVTAQYIMSIVLPQTTISLTDRLFILLSAKGLANNKTVTLYFGGNTPSHVHTTIPSIGGSGLVKVINGIMQNPASYLVDADVSASAAIAGTKIQTNYFALASATGGFVTTSQTGVFAPAAGTGVFALAAGTGSFVTTSQTGQFVFTGNTGSHITTGQTGAFAPAAGTGVFALAAGTGSFVTTSQTGAFAPAAGTGVFVTTGQTGAFGGGTTSVLTVTGTGYNISSSDYNDIIRYSGSGLTNSGLFTIPNNISNFAIGGSVLIAQVASGQVYFTGAAGTLLLINGSKSKTSARGATVTLTYTATNEWLVNGDII